ncbi:cell wall hydrolase [Pseudomonas japonica]|uniref:cell wall hydrolase n=1 Tax=Pseudomonas japonica TaxID=256466 RepID=UPI0015E43738|nr:cell wall hydrolase [Pseudomonas japonica]MBA1245502.1 cell wall hydrolase [Pseudomonas japonica]MBA1289567.1 cell wall hydrolase [Pseudomonas japonica]
MRCLASFICLAVLLCNALPAHAETVSARAEDKAQVLEEKAASDAPPPPQATLSKTEVQAVDPAGRESVDDAITCLARTVYWEAKGGSETNMEAVASVVMNRLGREGYANTVCGVVKQGSEKKNCQFSWWCDGRADQVQEEDRYQLAKAIAGKALNQQLRDTTGGALYFHDHRITTDWTKRYRRTAETDKFVFYAPRS